MGKKEAVPNRRYTEEFKIEAVKQVTDRGHSVADVAGRLGVSIRGAMSGAHTTGTPLSRGPSGMASTDASSGGAPGPASGRLPWEPLHPAITSNTTTQSDGRMRTMLPAVGAYRDTRCCSPDRRHFRQRMCLPS